MSDSQTTRIRALIQKWREDNQQLDITKDARYDRYKRFTWTSPDEIIWTHLPPAAILAHQNVEYQLCIMWGDDVVPQQSFQTLDEAVTELDLRIAGIVQHLPLRWMPENASDGWAFINAVVPHSKRTLRQEVTVCMACRIP